MTKDCFCGVYSVVFLVVIVAVENTLALTGPPGSVCGSECCPGWDQVGETCMAHCYNPCEHGTCVDTNICQCDPGWEGQQCEHDIDECWYHTHICHHNCENHKGCYTCSCDDGFQLINSTHCVNSTTANIDSTTATLPQTATKSNSLFSGGGADTDHHKVDMAIGVGVSAGALVLLFISIGIFIRYKKKKKTESSQQQMVSYHPQHPHGSLPGLTHTHWRNPVCENLYAERPETQTPPPPYEATKGCEATGGFATVAEISKGGITHDNVVSFGIRGMPVPSAIPESKEMPPPREAPVSLDPRHVGDIAATQRFDNALNEFHR
ncbi:NPNT [Branchiostoma lanceolatum]|uniref:NPNT protein n=1 Tax=Branchiostoma lanceolatum TaxID=7740 RepID=A0A8J9YJ58_BRALA|nr:NPNT [Branchiostoma lanceolatum]